MGKSPNFFNGIDCFLPHPFIVATTLHSEQNLLSFAFAVGEDVELSPAASPVASPVASGKGTKGSKSRRARELKSKSDGKGGKKGKGKSSTDDKSTTTTTISFEGSDFLDATGTLPVAFQGTFVNGNIVQAFGTDALGGSIEDGEVSNQPSSVPTAPVAPFYSPVEAPVATKGKSPKSDKSRRARF